MENREEECYYCIALTQVPHIGIRGAKRLYDSIGSAKDIFKFRKELADRIPDLNKHVIEWLDCPEALAIADKEMKFINEKNIGYYIIAEDSYPSRFKDCDDAPIIMFSKGNLKLNAPHVLNMVGTRQATDYGKQFCTTFIKELKTLCPDATIVSGLAYGIDITSHRAAVDNDLSTIGVLAHGLDRIYPSLHRNTAIKMLDKGGLLTEFISGTKPDAFNFVSRNRIIAGISDATIVVESAAKGGSLITADISESYHRDCFAVPGRINDEYSIGCNNLIHDNKAGLIYSGADFVKAMNWNDPTKEKKRVEVIQRDFFPTLSPEEQQIVKLLDERGNLQINTLSVDTNIPIYRISSYLFELEMKGVIRTLAGGVYQLLR
jgi:DNA processing protein